MNNNVIITIGRQYGSGGREVGRIISGLTGLEFYDSKLILEAARRSGIDTSAFERMDEKVPGFLSRALSFDFNFNSDFMPESFFKIQADTIKELAASGPCVLVGRCADYILRDYPGMHSVFIHAPLNYRIASVSDRLGITEEQAKDKITRTDKSRAAYYNFMTDKKWGDGRSYDLCVDSSVCGLEATAELVIDFIRKATGKCLTQ